MAGTYTAEEVLKHNKAGDAWIIVDGKVLDVSSFANEHPGGDHILISNAGKDVTEQFQKIHSALAKIMMKKHIIGTLEASATPPPKAGYTMEEVRKHNKTTDLWVVINGEVYDVTQWQELHPGGPNCFKRVAGTDCSQNFNKIHDPNMRSQMPKYRIGPLLPSSSSSTPGMSPVSGSEPTSKVGSPNSPGPKGERYELVEVKSISHNTKRMNFRIVTGETVPTKPLLPGGHMSFLFEEGGQSMYRNYTPVIYQPGVFEVVVKSYPGGLATEKRLHKMSKGDVAFFAGPRPPAYRLAEHRPNLKRLVLIAGGTGMAPIYSIAQSALEGSPSITDIIFIGCFRTEDEILLEDELVTLLNKHKSVHSTLILSQQKTECAFPHPVSSVFRMDRLSRENCAAAGCPRTWAKGTQMVCCGPKPLNERARQIFVQEFNYPEDATFLM